jgi:hypothetical protein
MGGVKHSYLCSGPKITLPKVLSGKAHYYNAKSNCLAKHLVMFNICTVVNVKLLQTEWLVDFILQEQTDT